VAALRRENDGGRSIAYPTEIEREPRKGKPVLQWTTNIENMLKADLTLRYSVWCAASIAGFMMRVAGHVLTICWLGSGNKVSGRMRALNFGSAFNSQLKVRRTTNLHLNHNSRSNMYSSFCPPTLARVSGRSSKQHNHACRQNERQRLQLADSCLCQGHVRGGPLLRSRLSMPNHSGRQFEAQTVVITHLQNDRHSER
jgi:hypothetical protein